MEITTDTGFGTRYSGLTWDDFDISVAPEVRLVRDECQRYARELQTEEGACANGIISGNIGTGKTMLASLIAETFRRAGRDVFKVSAYRALAFIRYRENQRLDGMYEALGELLKPELLFLDDVEPERMSCAEYDYLIEVLRTRYAEKRPTVVITDTHNYTRLAKEWRFQQFIETCSLNVEMLWKSYRRRHLKNNC